MNRINFSFNFLTMIHQHLLQCQVRSPLSSPFIVDSHLISETSQFISNGQTKKISSNIPHDFSSDDEEKESSMNE